MMDTAPNVAYLCTLTTKINKNRCNPKLAASVHTTLVIIEIAVCSTSSYTHDVKLKTRRINLKTACSKISW